MKIVSGLPFSLLAVVIVALALGGCVSNSKYEDMRERAEKAEAERELLLDYAARQDKYIRDLQRGMEIQARMTAQLRDTCEL